MYNRGGVWSVERGKRVGEEDAYGLLERGRRGEERQELPYERREVKRGGGDEEERRMGL